MVTEKPITSVLQNFFQPNVNTNLNKNIYLVASLQCFSRKFCSFPLMKKC
uniref:Uncharacterized protein n=1 Tax=Rhizophora mucronata TaxID=61149 RepID=A0A2P2IVQ6_RHIMU